MEAKEKEGDSTLFRRIKPTINWTLRCVGVLVAVIAVYVAVLFFTLPNVDHLVDENPSVTSYIIIWAEREGLNPDDYRITSWTDYDDIASLLKHATVYSEDTGFYNHRGVEWDLTRKMAWRFINGRRATGASTITQQLARNLYLEGNVSVHRKIREIMLALRLENKLSKERIIELYLNVIEWGDGIWGITRAVDHYFKKSPAELDPFECIFLPAMLPAPRRELSGANLYRATGVCRRLCYYLYKEDKMSIDEWAYAKRGLGPLEIALKTGRSLEDAIAAARAANVNPQALD